MNRLLLITGLAALLRLPTLAVESLWYDETFTAWLAGLPIDRLFAATLGDVHPPTWYLLEWMVYQSLGNTPFALRLISALAGIALVPAVWRLASAFHFSPEAQQSAALLTAVAPFAVYYSQEARAYSLIYLLTTVATIAVLERRWGLLVISATAALYLHNLTVFYIAALAWLALLHHQRPDWRMLLSFATVGILWLPWIVWGLSGQIGDVTNGFWVRPPTAGTPVYILTAWLFSSKANLLFMVTTPLLAIALFRSFSGPGRLELAGLLLIPMGLAIIASAIVAPILVERVIGSSAVALYLFIAPALVPGRWPRLAWSWPTVQHYALPAAFFLVLAGFYAAYWGTDRIGRYPWYYGLEEFQATANPATDGLFHANLATHITLAYYLPEYNQVVWKQANDLSQSLTEETKVAMGMCQVRFEDIACRHRRWWIFFYENPTTSDFERAEIARIVKQYHGRQVSTILENILVNARLYLVEPVCTQTASVQ